MHPMMDQRILFVLLNVRSMLCQIGRGLTKDVEYETDTSKKKSQFKARNGLRYRLKDQQKSSFKHFKSIRCIKIVKMQYDSSSEQ